MYARVLNILVAPDKLDDVIELWYETVMPSLKQQKRFISARVLVERQTGKILSMGLWETQADLLASVNWNQGQLDKFTAFFTAPPIEQHYEVAAEV